MSQKDSNNRSTAPRVAIIGCGLIGKKRIQCLAKGQVTVVCDPDERRAAELSALAGGAEVFQDAAKAVSSTACEAVIVATPNVHLYPIAKAALKAGKHVLVEKPCAMTVAEIDQLIDLSTKNRALVRAGYNHRYHPALMKAREIVESGVVGPLMFVRARYGHGGRLGYEKEWRADPRISGGGELMDQGVHLIDLSQMFLGQFGEVHGWSETYFWDMPVDDNAFLHLKSKQGQTAWLHVSCSEWKNLFSFEIYGRTGKLHIEGLGGSYGVEKLTHYQMLPEMGPPDTTVYEYPRGDSSWHLEMEEFWEDIALLRTPNPGLAEAREVLRVVEAVYRAR